MRVTGSVLHFVWLTMAEEWRGYWVISCWHAGDRGQWSALVAVGMLRCGWIWDDGTWQWTGWCRWEREKQGPRRTPGFLAVVTGWMVITFMEEGSEVIYEQFQKEGRTGIWDYCDEGVSLRGQRTGTYKYWPQEQGDWIRRGKMLPAVTSRNLLRQFTGPQFSHLQSGSNNFYPIGHCEY